MRETIYLSLWITNAYSSQQFNGSLFFDLGDYKQEVFDMVPEGIQKIIMRSPEWQKHNPTGFRDEHGPSNDPSGDNNSPPPFEDDEEQHDDGLFWNRGEDGDLVAFSDDDYLEDMDEDDEDFDDDDVHMLDKGHDRLMSEDIAGQMEI